MPGATPRKCIICHTEPAAVPDRDNPGSRTKKVCRKCHGERLIGDLKGIMAEVERRKANA